MLREKLVQLAAPVHRRAAAPPSDRCRRRLRGSAASAVRRRRLRRSARWTRTSVLRSQSLAQTMVSPGGSPNSLFPKITYARSGSLAACTRPACASRQNRCTGASLANAVAPDASNNRSIGGDRAPGGTYLVAPGAGPQVERDLLAGGKQRVLVGDVADQLTPRGVDVAGGLGDADLGERVVLGLLPGERRTHPFALVLYVRVVGAVSHADDRRRDRGGMHCAPRHFVYRGGVVLHIRRRCRRSSACRTGTGAVARRRP